MIDTIHLKFRIELIIEVLIPPWRRITCQRSDGSVKESYVYDIQHNGALIKLKYFPVDYIGNPLLIVQISSLPKVVHGNNHTSLFDIDHAINIINKLLKNVPGIPDVDIRDGVIHRIDFCFNYKVGDNVGEYMNAIGQLYYPRRDRQLYLNRYGANHANKQNNGVCFSSRLMRASFYDKQKECRDPEAYGILRHETSIKGPSISRQIKDRLNPTICDVTPAIALSVLQHDLEMLGLDRCIITNQSEALYILQNTYGMNKGYRMYELLLFLHGNHEKTKSELATIRGVTEQSINAWIRDINRAGISTAITLSNVSLPPLKIDM